MPAIDSYFITTPIYYVNDVPHLGHAYTTIACDALARFMRLDGKKVLFLTGTDEHGQKVEKSAQAAGQSPADFTNQVSQRFRDLTAKFEISNDDIIRTTEQRHIQAAQAIWIALVKSGDIYLGSYSGWYSVRDEAFFSEAELIDGGAGERLAPSGAPVEWVEEPSYFFRLSRWQKPLIKFYEENANFILPQSRRNEVVSFVSGGLQDLSVSRTSFKWGVPVPEDEDHIMYVWLDALTNYLTATGYPDLKSNVFETFWPTALHVVGKDILRFHAVYWPAFLMSAGIVPPSRVFAHGWWTVEGEKMSKSIRNVVEPFNLVDVFGLDQVRYFLLREVPFGNDGDFSKTALIHRINSDLANDLGNLAQRVLSMIHRNCDAEIPAPASFSDDDQILLSQVDDLLQQVRGSMEQQACHDALEKIWAVIRASNIYVDHEAPWALKKTDPIRMNTVLYTLAESLRNISILIQPFMPNAGGRMLNQLGVPGEFRTFSSLGANKRILAGQAIPKPVGVFPRFVADELSGG